MFEGQYIEMAAQHKIQALDLIVEQEEVGRGRTLGSGLRRSTREEMVLFHWHGLPRPRPNGEIWVFNRCPMVCMVMSILYLL